MIKIVNNEYTFKFSRNNVEGMSYDKENDVIVGKLRYNYGLDKIKENIKSGKIEAYVDDNFINFSFPFFKNKFNDHRTIKVNISSFIGICGNASHYYAKVILDPILCFKDETKNTTLLGSVNWDSSLEFDIWNNWDDIDIRIAKEKGEFGIEDSSTGFRSKEKLIEGIYQFINNFFEKEKFVVIISNDIKGLFTDSDIDYISEKIGIPTFLKNI